MHEDVCDEQDGETGLVLLTVEVEIRHKALQLSGSIVVTRKVDGQILVL